MYIIRYDLINGEYVLRFTEQPLLTYTIITFGDSKREYKCAFEGIEEAIQYFQLNCTQKKLIKIEIYQKDNTNFIKVYDSSLKDIWNLNNYKLEAFI